MCGGDGGGSTSSASPQSPEQLLVYKDTSLMGAEAEGRAGGEQAKGVGRKRHVKVGRRSRQEARGRLWADRLAPQKAGRGVFSP